MNCIVTEACVVPDILGVGGTVELSYFPSTFSLNCRKENLIPLCLVAAHAIHRDSVYPFISSSSEYCWNHANDYRGTCKSSSGISCPIECYRMWEADVFPILQWFEPDLPCTVGAFHSPVDQQCDAFSCRGNPTKKQPCYKFQEEKCCENGV